MQVRGLFVVLGATLLLGACGSENDVPSPAATVQSQDLCGDGPTVLPSGQLMMHGCSYIQQIYNIVHNGMHLSDQGLPLFDASGQVPLNVTDRCGRYYLGHDAAGVDIIVVTDTGDALSHGLVHAGEQLSGSVPAKLALPLRLAQ